MRRLGYDRYGAHGNDAGSLVSPEVGRFDPEHVIGVHVTQIFSFPSGNPAELEGLSKEDMNKVQFLQWFNENMGGLRQAAVHRAADPGTRPGRLPHESRTRLLSRHGQKRMRRWSFV